MDTVPVVLDSISNDREATPLARCIYFHIEFDETLDPWQLGIAGSSIPFFMVGLAGIVMAPSFTEPRFSNVGQLSELVGLVEAREGHSLETADVWLPMWLLPRRNIHRGTVLRIERDLFLTALVIRASGDAVLDAFANVSGEGAIEVSPEETVVFADWSKIQVSEFGRWENREQPPRRQDARDGDQLER